jgi:hypothetical protein
MNISQEDFGIFEAPLTYCTENIFGYAYVSYILYVVCCSMETLNELTYEITLLTCIQMGPDLNLGCSTSCPKQASLGFSESHQTNSWILP